MFGTQALKSRETQRSLTRLVPVQRQVPSDTLPRTSRHLPVLSRGLSGCCPPTEPVKTHWPAQGLPWASDRSLGPASDGRGWPAARAAEGEVGPTPESPAPLRGLGTAQTLAAAQPPVVLSCRTLSLGFLIIFFLLSHALPLPPSPPHMKMPGKTVPSRGLSQAHPRPRPPRCPDQPSLNPGDLSPLLTRQPPPQ